MGQYTSYYLYQKYESRGGQNPLPVYPYVYSIDGEGTLSRVVKLQSDPACGGGSQPEATYQWVNIPISTDYWCDGSDKHYKQKQQVSYDNGSTWQDVVPASYRMGALYQSNSPDCGYLPMERWTNSGTTCQGVDKYQIQVKETSTDGGSTWHQTSETRTVLLEANSPDCGGGGGGGSYETKYLTFKTLESGTFTWKNSVNANNVYYSVDSGTNWTILYVNESTQTIAAGREVWWKASGLAVDDSYGIGRFASTGRFNVEGNVMSLVSGDSFANATTITNSHQFYALFYNCQKVVSAENLVLPATTLTTYCYASMFYYCIALTTAPTLPAPTLAQSCYSQMFINCSSLNNVTCLATTLARNSTYTWLYGVAASGTFYKASSMSDWPRTTSGIPSGWTVQNA